MSLLYTFAPGSPHMYLSTLHDPLGTQVNPSGLRYRPEKRFTESRGYTVVLLGRVSLLSIILFLLLGDIARLVEWS